MILAFIGLILIEFIKPIVGHTLGQGNWMVQKDMMTTYPDNKSIMHSIMGEYTAKGNYYITSTTQNSSPTSNNVECARFWLEKAIKLHEMHLKNPKTTTSESQMEIMDQMKRAYKCLTGEGTKTKMSRNVSTSNINIKCARSGLEKAIKLNFMHIKNPQTANKESQMKMMNQMNLAYKCIIGENVTNKKTKMERSHML